MFTFYVSNLKKKPKKGEGNCILSFTSPCFDETAKALRRALEKAYPSPDFKVEMTESENSNFPSNGW